MRLSQLLYPERVIALAFKCFVAILAFLFIGSLALSALPTLRISASGALGLLIGLGLTSLVAFFIRERRLARQRSSRPQRPGTAERTPVFEGDEWP